MTVCDLYSLHRLYDCELGDDHAAGIRELIESIRTLETLDVRYVTFNRQYRIAGKFGGELNLAVWRSILQPPNLNPPKFPTRIYMYGDPVPNRQI
jgi:hypothetical protein